MYVVYTPVSHADAWKLNLRRRSARKPCLACRLASVLFENLAHHEGGLPSREREAGGGQEGDGGEPRIATC